MPEILERVKALFTDTQPKKEAPLPPDGSSELLKSGLWPATQAIPIVTFPHELVLTGTDRNLARHLKKPATLARKKMGKQVVELLLESGGDGSVSLSMRVPTAPTQFKEPYLLMEAEGGNSHEVALKEFYFHLQGRLSEKEVAEGKWLAFFKGAASRLKTIRARATPGSSRAKQRRPATKKRRPAGRRNTPSRKRRR
jgi:hypothetical protein